MALAGRTP
uniref:Uncharacterized protein n=1 Tax=Arundo donax TaxID=35708 RepID=A0A0A9FBA5_ARUDO